MNPRIGAVERKTAETQIKVSVNLDGSGKSQLATGIGFFDHMLDQIARHGTLDLTIEARGDLHIDGHHTVEDVGITFGQGSRQRSATRRASGVTAMPTCRSTRRCRGWCWTSRDARASNGMCHSRAR
jgi:imidazoleglycerol phosphate dehydratase HisB